jgi:hypothetical protein
LLDESAEFEDDVVEDDDDVDDVEVFAPESVFGPVDPRAGASALAESVLDPEPVELEPDLESLR